MAELPQTENEQEEPRMSAEYLQITGEHNSTKVHELAELARRALHGREEKVRQALRESHTIAWRVDMPSDTAMQANHAGAVADLVLAAQRDGRYTGLPAYHGYRAEAVVALDGADRDEWTIDFNTVRPTDHAVVWLRCGGAVERDAAPAPVGARGLAEHTALRARVDALEHGAARKDRYLAMLGHELRNPLAPLQTGLKLIQYGADDQHVLDRAVAMMQRQLAHLTHLVDDLIDLSRISCDVIALRSAPLDMHDVVAAAVELSAPLLSERRHDLSVTCGDGTLPVEGDFHRLTQVIANLLSNAAKYTAPGGQIRVTGALIGADVTVRVQDNGQGIPCAQLENVFEMFTQLLAPGERGAGGGFGVGLALARQLATLHGGSIEAMSAGLGQGSEFVLRLPRAAPAVVVSRCDAARQATVSADRQRLLAGDDGAQMPWSHGKSLSMSAAGLRCERDAATANQGNPE